MKSNQERSNGCLPPKKREILALEQRPVVVTTASPPAAVLNDSPHTENLAWLASVASERCKSRDSESPRCTVSSSSLSSVPPSASAPLSAVPLASLPTVYPTAIPQQAGPIQFAQLGPNVQFISTGPYAGYISSQIISANHASAPNSSTIVGQRHHIDGYTTALISPHAKGEQQFQIGLSPADLAPVSLPSSTQVTSQYIHLDGRTPLSVSGSAVASPAHLQLHSHPTVFPQTLTLAPSQLLVQYADGPAGKRVEGHSKASLNGELELIKQCKTQNQAANHHQQIQSYEARHILLPADYGQNPSGLQTSLVLVAQPNSGHDHEASNKISLVQMEKGGICLGKPVSRASSFTSLSSTELVKSAVSHAIMQTTLPHEELPATLYSSAQPPIIGYITSANQHTVSYHTALPQHLVIPSGQSLLIPVSGSSNSTDMEASRTVNTLTTSATTPQISTSMPHAYLATALSKCDALASDAHQPLPAVAQAPMLPALPSTPSPAMVASPSPAPGPVPAPPPVSIQASPSISSSSSPVALPPFFMRGSIIQLADGELKRVEDLKTEDFIQSAEISNELKIDSSTVERIDTGQSPNAVIIQFSVGELKAQVCVEVLVEYPFFVFGQGWSSCCPDRTTQLFELSCAKLCVGDVCVSLTLRGLRNGSLTDTHVMGAKLRTGHPTDSDHNGDPVVRNNTSLNAAGSNSSLLMKAGQEQGSGPAPGPGLELPPRLEVVPGPREEMYGTGTPRDTAVSGSGQVRQESLNTDMPPLSKIPCGDPDRPAVRKRRWSAPERDQTERVEDEPPLTLPKSSFIPQEVKISIEGHSSAGMERWMNKRVDC
ncbi:ataxin-1-like [Genypterus blacodes]|uniref:ataxin-1-like n=1 Tax=Genypterus blacodes TaxID=154954 RepID=UPI003F76AB2F